MGIRIYTCFTLGAIGNAGCCQQLCSLALPARQPPIYITPYYVATHKSPRSLAHSSYNEHTEQLSTVNGRIGAVFCRCMSDPWLHFRDSKSSRQYNFSRTRCPNAAGNQHYICSGQSQGCRSAIWTVDRGSTTATDTKSAFTLQQRMATIHSDTSTQIYHSSMGHPKECSDTCQVSTYTLFRVSEELTW